MKIIVISDVHGNLPALEAVLNEIERRVPDMLVVNGDLVNRGPNSRACLNLLQRQSFNLHFIRGNHESFTLDASETPLNPGDNLYSLHQFAHWTAEELGEEALRFLSTWNKNIDMTDLDGGSSFHITHGSVLGERDGISEKTPDDVLLDKLGSHRDLFVASHTHKAMKKYFKGRIVVNTGSVGQPLDEDERASFAEFRYDAGGWSVEPIRLKYDRQSALDAYTTSGFVSQAGPMPLLIYCEHRLSRMCVGPMMNQYYKAINSGTISLHDAINEYLQKTGLMEKIIEWDLDYSALQK
ncbi:MAG: metallophosphatase family protein [Gammaproteobacteria bacterium]|nr:metallophosphatase family protein [Gammaproteobacteria bacterium]